MDYIVISIQRVMIFTSFGLPMLCGAVGEFAVNIAYGKPATQSSTYIGRTDYGDTPGYLYKASLAVDGNTDTTFKNDGCSHTDLNSYNAWWEVDLLDLYNVINITIYQRTDGNASWLSGFVTKGKVSNNSFVIIDNPKSNMTGKITIPVNTSLKFKAIKIELIKLNKEHAAICLCEVEVLAEMNVAEKKLAKQSSTYFESTYFNASFAVDGNTNSDFSMKSCSCTNPDDNNPWWSVDLNALYFIIGIRIYQRMDSHQERLKGFTLVGVHANGSHETIQTPQPYQAGVIVMRVAPSRMLKEIRVHLKHSDLPEGPIITLCEVQVFAVSVKRCNQPVPQVPFGVLTFQSGIDGNGTYNTTVSLNCIQGYKRDIYGQLRCADNGEWHGSLGHCLAITCSMPSLDSTMGTYACTERVAGACAYKSMLTIQCNTGYKLSGYNSSQCNGTDNWSRNMGVCVAITCNMLSLDPTMGTYSCTEHVAGACAYKSMLTIQCNTGYKLSGYNSSQCIGTDNWSRNIGVCVAIACSMPPLNKTMGTYECNERVAGACAYNSILTIQCNRGYKLSGYNSSQCIGTDLWNRSIGVCDAIPCHIPDIDSKKGIYELHPVHAGNMSYTSYLTIKCKEGYRLNGSDIIRCTSTGEWDTSIGQCTAIQCSVPFVLPNNSIYLYEEGIEGNLTFNSTISFRCQEGYKVYGTDVIRCNEFGIWDRLFGTCHVIDCGWPEDVPNDVPLLIMSGIAGGFSYNATACIKSNEGFTKFQDMYESLRCSGEGYWKGNLRECFEITEKESCMDQDGKKIILPIAVLVPICLILIATNIATFLKYRRYACHQGHPSEQIQVDITIADQFGSSQNEITKREQTRLSHTNGDIELQRRKRRSEEIHSQGTEQYDELQIDHRQISEYDELQFKRDLTSNKGTMNEDTDEFAQI